MRGTPKPDPQRNSCANCRLKGHTTKGWVTQNGRRHDGKVIDLLALFTMLRNRLYLGEMTHKGQSFPGQHEPIITTELWAAVHAFVERRKMGPRIRHKKEPALLTGLLYAPDNQRMLPTYTQKKNGKRYRYYVPYLEKRQSAGATCDPTIRNIGPLPALEIEAAVLAQVHKALQQPEMIVGGWQAGMALRERQQMDEPTVLVAEIVLHQLRRRCRFRGAAGSLVHMLRPAIWRISSDTPGIFAIGPAFTTSTASS